MEFTKRFPVCARLLAAFVFFTAASVLCAQEDETVMPGYFVDSNEHIRQRLVWNREMYALNYEVVIQVFENAYRDYATEVTEGHFLEVSLPPGRYRYRVTPFDLFGQRAEASAWNQFDVIAAFIPAIERFLPAVFYLDQKLERVLHISGVNFLEESVFYLENELGRLYPVETRIINNQRAELFFDDEKLIEGVYNIRIENQEVFVDVLSGFVIDYKKPLDYFTKIAWVPAIPVYGDLADIFGVNLFLTGAAFNFEAISSKRGDFNGGLELGVSVYWISHASSFKLNLADIVYDFSTFRFYNGVVFADFDLNIALQRRFNQRRNAFTFRFGLGISLLSGYGSYAGSELVTHFNLGASFLFLTHDIFFIEAGTDYSHYMSDRAFGLIKPRLAIVWQF
ncbi:MAG: hypothetical protein FWD40_04915 [Treponema sp.]|nr:hypothetical protein [Treponema sp.]